MGWSIGFDGKWNRDIGYGVPAQCDFPGCEEEIDRGLGYVCGSEPYGGDRGCGLYFCSKHRTYHMRLHADLCPRCERNRPPYPAKPDVLEWIRFKLTDPSWAQWREEHPKEVFAMKLRDTNGMKKEFTGTDDFQAWHLACGWLKENGYSYGSMCRDMPIGILGGDYLIAKWRNLNDAERKELDGVMTSPNFRSGPVMVEIYGERKA